MLHKFKQKVKEGLRIKEILNYQTLKPFRNKKGLEIGGPSLYFSTELPIYQVAKCIDGCNFGTATVWEGLIKEGLNYNYLSPKVGYQYILEASDLHQIKSETYDFLVASHCLEHCANPLKTITEWLRVVKPNGYLLLILPNKEHTFDHKRPVTSFEHLLSDYKNNTGENDLSHLDEILALHDLNLDKPAGDLNSFRQRSLQNFQNRCLHHHVYDFDLLRQIFDYFDIKIIHEKLKDVNQIIIGQKIKPVVSEKLQNAVI